MTRWGKCDYCGEPAVAVLSAWKGSMSKPWFMRRKIRGCRAHTARALATATLVADVRAGRL